MDMRVVGLLAGMHQEQQQDGAARDRAAGPAPRLDGKRVARVALAALFAAAMALAPVVTWPACISQPLKPSLGPRRKVRFLTPF